MNPKYVTLQNIDVYIGYSKGLAPYEPYRCQLKKDHQLLDSDNKFRFEYPGGRIAAHIQDLLVKLNLTKLYVFTNKESEWSVTQCERFQKCEIIAAIANQQQYELVSETCKSKFIKAIFTNCAPCWCVFPGVDK